MIKPEKISPKNLKTPKDLPARFVRWWGILGQENRVFSKFSTTGGVLV